MRRNDSRDNKPRRDDDKVKGLAVEVWNNDINKALRRLKKKLQDDGLFQTLRDREFYTKPSTKRAKAKAAGIARWKKKQRDSELTAPSNHNKSKR